MHPFWGPPVPQISIPTEDRGSAAVYFPVKPPFKKQHDDGLICSNEE